jgi:outer membrane protein TolC
MRHLMIAALAALAFPAAATAQNLTLEDAMRLGEAQSPRLSAQRHAITAADEQAVRAGELPDPRMRVGIENLPVTGPDAYRTDRDFMTARAVGLMQEFPNAEKRAARGARAQQARGVEQATLDFQRAALQRDIAMAWLEVHFAERARGALEALAAQSAGQADLSAPAVQRGRLGAAESLMLRSGAEQARDRVLEAGRAVRKARIALAALLGEEASRRVLGAAPDLDRLPAPREALLGRLHEHPHLRVYDRREDLARADVDLARASRNSDWSVEVGYGVRRPAFDNMLTVMVAIDLPWQRGQRQDRDVAAKVAEFEQSRAVREEARRVHEAELRGWLADYDIAGERAERYRALLLPLARDRYEAALAAYRGGRGELNPVLEAGRAVTEAELGLVGVLAERGRAWANLSFLYPHEAHR